MEILLFTAINPDGDNLELSYWGESLEMCLSMLTELVENAWQIVAAKIQTGGGYIHLPVEAIDGQPMNEPLRALQQQWEILLESVP